MSQRARTKASRTRKIHQRPRLVGAFFCRRALTIPWAAGTFSRSNGVNTGSTTWAQDRDAGTKILATRHDTHDQDLADGINACLKKDGANAATGDLDLGGNRFTNAGDGTARDDLSTVGQVQDGDNVWADAGGTADAITATYSPTVTALVDGMELRVRAAAANATTTPTFAPNGLTAYNIVKTGGNALVAGDIAGDGHELILRYDLSNTRWELLNPAVPAGVLGQNSETELTISSGAVTVTGSQHSIDTEGDASSDDLDTLTAGTGIVSGALCLIRPNNASRTVIVKNGTGNITTADGADITLDNIRFSVLLKYDGSGWVEVLRFTFGVEVLYSASLNSGTTLEITDIPQSFRALIVDANSISHDNGSSRAPIVRLSDDNGSTYETTNYNGGLRLFGTGDTPDVTDAIFEGLSVTAADSQNFTLVLTGYQEGVGCHANYVGRASGNAFAGQGRYAGTEAINALQLRWDGAGSFDGSGTVVVAGIR